MTTSIQQQEQTINDLDNYKIGYMPHYMLFIGEERFNYELSEYNLLTEQVSTIYKNINEYKDKKIEIGFEYGEYYENQQEESDSECPLSEETLSALRDLL